jgi:hypothetical protein
VGSLNETRLLTVMIGTRRKFSACFGFGLGGRTSVCFLRRDQEARNVFSNRRVSVGKSDCACLGAIKQTINRN